MIDTAIALTFHLDDTLAALARDHSTLLVVLLFLVIFAETGVVVFPFLPGDSLLFVTGAVCASTGVDVHLVVATLVFAAILGDSVNYAVGAWIGPKAFNLPPGHRLAPYIRREYLEKTQSFYDRFGGFTIVIGRFVPIVRTFAPFLAGVAGMRYRRFAVFNMAGALVWVASLTYAGYLFGNIPWAKKNLSLIVVGIVVVSVLPIAIQYWKERRAGSRPR